MPHRAWRALFEKLVSGIHMAMKQVEIYNGNDTSVIVMGACNNVLIRLYPSSPMST